jgi:TIR domain
MDRHTMLLNEKQQALLRLLLAAKFTHTQLEEIAQLLGVDLTGTYFPNKSSKAQELVSRCQGGHSLEELVALTLGKGPVQPMITPDHLQEAEDELRPVSSSVPLAAQAPAIAAAQVMPALSDPAAEPCQFDYDVALSFAGEDREYVHAVARSLKNAGVLVFYDGFEEASLWGKNLFDHLTEVYNKRARYCIIFGSVHYAQKIWPNAERQAAQARALRSKAEYVLPARFDDTEIPGVLDAVGYIDLRHKSPEELAALFLSKLGRCTEHAE